MYCKDLHLIQISLLLIASHAFLPTWGLHATPTIFRRYTVPVDAFVPIGSMSTDGNNLISTTSTRSTASTDPSTPSLGILNPPGDATHSTASMRRRQIARAKTTAPLRLALDPSRVQMGVPVMLFFVNAASGGGQGRALYNLLCHTVNPHQVRSRGYSLKLGQLTNNLRI